MNIIKNKNKVTSINLTGAIVPEDSLVQIKGAKVKEEKKVFVTLPDGEKIEISEKDKKKNGRTKASKRQTAIK